MNHHDDPKPHCFLAIPYSSKYELIREAVRDGAMEAGYLTVSINQGPLIPGTIIQETIIGEIAKADCVIADVSGGNPNIFFELGLAQAMGKGIIIISDGRTLNEAPFDIREFRIIIYPDDSLNLSDFSRKISLSLRELRRYPKQSRISLYPQFSPPFFVEWERLSRSETENLCQELLAQMGFRRLDWGKASKEIDLIAELPRKDPDGFEYRDLWLISMGLRAPIEMIVDMASQEPEYLLHRLLRYSDRLGENFSQEYESSITILLVLFQKGADTKELDFLKDRLNKRRYKREPSGLNVRLRIWDQNYLTSLVQRFPQIGYKYFSDEGRIRSKTRKSYEELYHENSDFAARQANLISALEEEKNKRVRAERDSVWKDISFSAAHKIGNPIFAIETDLGPLIKRIREERKTEAVEVIENIRSSIEKAKAFVEQFKSLAKAQEINIVPTLLRPILEDACKTVSNQGIECIIDCPIDLTVHGDPDRLAECFDELVMNASHWLDDKPQKQIMIDVNHPAPEPIPAFLDSTQEYILIHVKDNGCGIPATDKNRIFDAFFTKYIHGTGLGLALVRRIIDGHGGGIIETGIHGKGADFEVYLPLRSEEDKKNILIKQKVNVRRIRKEQ